MKKKLLRRTLAIVSASALCALSVGLFAGCTTDYPEITITYTFNDVDYEVDYTLSREATPRTVQHFIDLADAGYYDGTCIHNYSANFLYGGGYYFDDGELTAKDYYTEVKKIEAEKGEDYFEQSVYLNDSTAPDNKGEGLYTVYGEMWDNGYQYTGSRGYSHTTGALVMYYSYTYAEEGNNSPYTSKVTIARADGGAAREDGKLYQQQPYLYNSATSLFYTFTGENRSDLNQQYCVFGMAKYYSKQMTGEDGLLTAIDEYIGGLSTEESFTETSERFSVNPNEHELEEEGYSGLYSEKVRAFFSNAKSTRKITYDTPTEMPIIIKSVKVNKY